MKGLVMDEKDRDIRRVELGTHVEVELVDESGETQRLAFDVVPDAQADFAHGFLGAGTPLGQAILGQPEGSSVPYHVGDMAEARVLRVTGGASAPSDDVEAKRQAVIREAVEQSERINDMTFALAAGSKWGDYDPGGGKDDPPLRESAGAGERGERRVEGGAEKVRRGNTVKE